MALPALPTHTRPNFLMPCANLSTCLLAHTFMVVVAAVVTLLAVAPLLRPFQEGKRRTVHEIFDALKESKRRDHELNAGVSCGMHGLLKTRGVRS